MESARSRLVSLLFKAGRIIDEQMRARYKVDPVSFLRLHALRFIAQKKNPSARELSTYLCITPSSASSLINSMVKTRLISRKHDAIDHRLVRLMLTKSGEHTVAEGSATMAKHMEEIFSPLNQKEQLQFIRILEKLEKSYE